MEVRYPPPEKGYLSDTGAIPYENKAIGCDTPLCDTISKGYCAIWGEVSRTGPLSPLITKTDRILSSTPRQTKPKKGQFMNFSHWQTTTKIFQCESRLFSPGKTPEFTKMVEIHELFVLALSSVWFAGATPVN